ncbi:MAG: hypothetical protein IJ764_02565, partial [Bacteroidales bacterium]|nr:hypothetical protein [Bacteroidales bacterium]
GQIANINKPYKSVPYGIILTILPASKDIFATFAKPKRCISGQEMHRFDVIKLNSFCISITYMCACIIG